MVKTNDLDFDRFWAAYPRHVAKAVALKAWRRLQPTTEMVDAMIAALSWQREQPTWKQDRYIPHPSTWLNGKRWEDERPKALVTDDEISHAAEVRRRVYGRCPHDPKCLNYRTCVEEIALYIREKGAA